MVYIVKMKITFLGTAAGKPAKYRNVTSLAIELENSDYNFLYDVLLYGTPGWANYTDEEVVRKFQNIFER